MHHVPHMNASRATHEWIRLVSYASSATHEYAKQWRMHCACKHASCATHEYVSSHTYMHMSSATHAYTKPWRTHCACMHASRAALERIRLIKHKNGTCHKDQRHGTRYRVAKMHGMPYLHRSFSAKEPCNYPLHRMEILIEILSKTKLFRPKLVTP